MSRPPSVSQVLKRVGLAKRPRPTKTSSASASAADSNGSTSLGSNRDWESGIIQANGGTGGAAKNTDMGDVDDRIAALERELEEGTESSDESHDSDESSEDDTESARDEGAGGKSVVSKFVSPLGAEKIAPLPAHLLPHAGCGIPKSNNSRKLKRSKVAKEKPETSPGLAKVVEELLNNYEARSSERVPFYCRVCKFEGDSLEALEKHKQEPLHLEATKRERKICRCSLCKKGFTSPAQLQEHLSGRSHREMMERVRARQGKPLPRRNGGTGQGQGSGSGQEGGGGAGGMGSSWDSRGGEEGGGRRDSNAFRGGRGRTTRGRGPGRGGRERGRWRSY